MTGNERDVESVMDAYGITRETAVDALQYFGLVGTAFMMERIAQEGLSYSYFANVVLPVKRLIANQGLSVSDISDLFQEHHTRLFDEGFPVAYAVAMNGFGRLSTENIRPICGVRGRELRYEDLDPSAHKKVGNALGECHNDTYAPVGGDDEANYGITKLNLS